MRERKIPRSQITSQQPTRVLSSPPEERTRIPTRSTVNPRKNTIAVGRVRPTLGRALREHKTPYSTGASSSAFNRPKAPNRKDKRQHRCWRMGIGYCHHNCFRKFHVSRVMGLFSEVYRLSNICILRHWRSDVVAKT